MQPSQANRSLTAVAEILAAMLVVALVLVAAPLSGLAGAGDPCHLVEAAGAGYSVCEFDLRRFAVKLFLRDAAGRPYGGLANLVAALSRSGTAPVFAMNAGMYAPDLSPVGLYIEGGVLERKANQANGPGNFHLKPNGVFYVRGMRAGVLETSAYLRLDPHPDFATQSGPMLVINGKIHPRFVPDSDSRKIRNGVGVRDGHVVVFAISSSAVTFTEFAELFRDTLGCPDALFLDGSISSLYAPSLQRQDALWPAGPMVAAFARSP